MGVSATKVPGGEQRGRAGRGEWGPSTGWERGAGGEGEGGWGGGGGRAGKGLGRGKDGKLDGGGELSDCKSPGGDKEALIA